MIYFNKKENNQSGFALVLTLSILFTIMFSVLVVSSIIAGEVRVSNNVVNSVVSYYAAESGIERGLFYLKESRDANDFSIFTALNGTTTDMVNGASYLIATTSVSAPDFTATDVSTSTPVYVDIIEPPGDVNSINWNSLGAADTYELNWAILNCFPEHKNKRLQININSFEANYTNPVAETKLAICNCSLGSDNCGTYSGPVAGNKYYRFSFKPLDVKVKQIDFSINNSGYGIPSETIIESYGSYKAASYYMKAQLPAYGSTFDIFQYIIFSEENLSK